MKSLLLCVLLGITLAPFGALKAEDRDGLLFLVGRKTLSRDDESRTYLREINRDLVLKATVKNLSMKDREPGTADYAILIRRWGGEIGDVQRYAGKVDLPAIKRGQTVEIETKSFHMGGHMHGTSRMHMDEMEAWRFALTIEGKTTEFRSSAKFASLDQKAKPGE